MTLWFPRGCLCLWSGGGFLAWWGGQWWIWQCALTCLSYWRQTSVGPMGFAVSLATRRFLPKCFFCTSQAAQGQNLHLQVSVWHFAHLLTHSNPSAVHDCGVGWFRPATHCGRSVPDIWWFRLHLLASCCSWRGPMHCGSTKSASQRGRWWPWSQASLIRHSQVILDCHCYLKHMD